jgi:hypothetical protein
MDPDFGEGGNQIETIKTTSPVRFYPNPAKSFIEILSPSAVESVSLFDITGRKALSQSKGARVDVRSLPKGAYIISIKDATGEYRSKLIVE